MKNLPTLRRIEYDNHENYKYPQLKAGGYKEIGTLHTYELSVPTFDESPVIRKAESKHLQSMINIGLSVFRHSRFYTDPEIPFETAQQVYEARIRNSFLHDIVWVALMGEEVVGFCSLRDNEIELIAVSTAYQGMGVGRRLVESCISFIRARGGGQLKIKTQGSNHAARSLYRKIGFKCTRIQKEFHKHGNVDNAS